MALSAVENSTLHAHDFMAVPHYYGLGGEKEDLWSKTLGVECPGPAATFYGFQAICIAVLWLVVKGAGGSDFFRQTFSFHVALRPSWMPLPVLMFLHQRSVYLAACYSMVPLMALASALPDWWCPRALVAIAVTIYQLVESSVTFSHRDYLMLYNCWALFLLPDRYAEGMALGFCVHFIASSGFAKVFIGGRDWVHPITMRSILSTYGEYSLREGGPFSPTINRLIVKHEMLSAGDGVATLLFECVLIPLALAIPVGLRAVLPLLAVTMAVLHVGIFVCQSALIGFFFIPNLASYALGFGAHVYMGSQGWIPALLICCASIGLVFLRGPRLLPEDWPITPFALFGWSGKQWNILFDTFVRGRTRLVISADPTQDLVGSVVMKKGMRGALAAGSHKMVYDAWDLCFGETTIQLDILDALNFDAMREPDWDATAFTRAVELWLQQQRMIELVSRRPLLRAFFVEIDAKDQVCRVLARGTPSERQPLLSSP
eukprot:TRINITY_DN19360_c0_g5_i1.p1 TRINITY_DN19360_c0_g5~~TRINITY_DN19360_c0_g5_i1.p1  ORF type:complete len:488 (-),score=36.07 TRINITY_DN19360_c0_g5_i1:199-1662(-)